MKRVLHDPDVRVAAALDHREEARKILRLEPVRLGVTLCREHRVGKIKRIIRPSLVANRPHVDALKSAAVVPAFQKVFGDTGKAGFAGRTITKAEEFHRHGFSLFGYGWW